MPAPAERVDQLFSGREEERGVYVVKEEMKAVSLEPFRGHARELMQQPLLRLYLPSISSPEE